MSLDYPEFRKLQAKQPRLELLWRVGDIGYYWGLLGTVIYPILAVSHRLTASEGDKFASLTWPKVLLLAFSSSIFFFIIWISSASLKKLAFDLGGGIEKYYDADD